MSLDKLVGDAQIIAVICNQFGDTGKGKFSDYFASNWADVTARGTGGTNAGHTVDVKGEKRIFHLLPAGIANDAQGKVTIMGNGMVIDLAALNEELNDLDSHKMTYNNLMISEDAHVTMPYHLEKDQEGKSQRGGGIGTTGRGVGPTYGDKITREGIPIRDLFDNDALRKGIEKAIRNYPKQKINIDDTINYISPYAKRIKPLVRDTVTEIHNFVREGKRILIEGAQGLLLSIEHGTYPYCTSSDCSLNGTASGVGLPASIVKSFGIVKFPFMTRVGGGPFPTEFGGEQSALYCAQSNGDGKPLHSKKNELEDAKVPYVYENGEIKYDHHHPNILRLMNSSDPFIKGIGIRLSAEEYGATTTRPRRIGATDAVMARYAVSINGPNIILTKADSIAGIDNFDICFGYNLNGQKKEFNKNPRFLSSVTPVYRTYPGYSNIRDLRNYNDLPSSLKESKNDFEAFTGGRIVAISVGSERDKTIII